MGGRTGIVGTCRTSADGNFTLMVGSIPRTILSGEYQRLKYSLRLFPNEAERELYYVRWPRS